MSVHSLSTKQSGIPNAGNTFSLGSHYDRVRLELIKLGVSSFAMGRLESRYLPSVIHKDEHLKGVVYGKHTAGFAMMVATDKRVIFLDKKPFFVNLDEINYDVVSGVSFGHAGLSSTVTLHTRIKDYSIRTFNQKCALQFVENIESNVLEKPVESSRYVD